MTGKAFWEFVIDVSSATASGPPPKRSVHTSRVSWRLAISLAAGDFACRCSRWSALPGLTGCLLAYWLRRCLELPAFSADGSNGAIMSKVVLNIVIIGGTLIVLAWALKDVLSQWG